MSRLVQEYLRRFVDFRYVDDPEDLNYNNLLSIENCIIKLYKAKKITDLELKIIQHICIGYNYLEISRLLNISRKKVSDTFKEVCDRISYVLGDDFSDIYLETIFYG